MSGANFLFCVIVFLGLFGFTPGRTQQTEPYERQWNKIVTLIDALNRLYDKNGFPTRALSPVDSPPSPFFRRINRCQAWAFGDDHTFAIDFKQDSDEVLDFDNWSAFNSIEGPNAPLHSSKPVPTWPEARVARVARECSLIFFPDMAKTAIFDGASYSTNHKSGSSYYDGQWTAILRRTSRDGYPFRSDFINVQIGEHTGPLSAVMRIPSIFPERQYHPISKDEAAIATAKGLELFRKSQVSSWVLGPSTIIQVVDQPKLEIVNPFDTDATSLEDYAHSQSVNATLAWVTGYLLETPAPSGSSIAAQKYHVAIFVGAEDSRYLGADF